MMMLVCLLLAVGCAFAFRNPLRKVPWVFYCIAAILDVVVIYSSDLGLPQWLFKSVIMANGRCLFAYGLFCVVLFIGALKDGSRAKKWLAPIRAELSILAAILVLGHIVRYLGIYSPRILSSTADPTMLASFAVACVIAILLVVLTVTSFKFVRIHIKPSLWKNIQRLAYPFFILIYAHVLLIVWKSALRAANGAVETLVVMGVITVAYIVLRLVRYRQDKMEKGEVKSNKPKASNSTAVTA